MGDVSILTKRRARIGLPRVTAHWGNHIELPALDRKWHRRLLGTRRSEFIVILVDEGARGPGGAVGQAADRRAGHDAHRLFQFQEHLDVARSPAAVEDAVEDLVHPGGPFAAGRALAAGLVGQEALDDMQDLGDVRGLVEDYGPAGPHEGAQRPHAVEVELFSLPSVREVAEVSLQEDLSKVKFFEEASCSSR